MHELSGPFAGFNQFRFPPVWLLGRLGKRGPTDGSLIRQAAQALSYSHARPTIRPASGGLYGGQQPSRQTEQPPGGAPLGRRQQDYTLDECELKLSTCSAGFAIET